MKIVGKGNQDASSSSRTNQPCLSRVLLHLHSYSVVKWPVFFSWKTQFQMHMNLHYYHLPDLPPIIKATLDQTSTIEIIHLYSSNQTILLFGDSAQGKNSVAFSTKTPKRWWWGLID